MLLASALAAPARAQTFIDIHVEKIDDPLIAGEAVWGDYNADGNLDLISTGLALPQSATDDIRAEAILYRHMGLQGTLEGVMHRVFEHRIGFGLWMSDAAWGDPDGDGDLDLFLCGATSHDAPYAPAAMLLRYEGGLSLEPAAELAPVYGCAGAWGDYDSDGDHDLFYAGRREDGTHASFLLENRGGTLVDVVTSLPAIAFGAVDWADADNDGDQDIALIGVLSSGEFLADVFLNDGGRFTPSGAGLTGVAFGSLDWGDYDNDGDLDLLISGAHLGPTLLEPKSIVYENGGDGTFGRHSSSVLGKYMGGVAWGDLNNDGLLDFIEGGALPFREPQTDMYLNAAGAFMRRDNSCPVGSTACLPFEGVALGGPLLVDLDNDGDLDLMQVGLEPGRHPHLQFDRSDDPFADPDADRIVPQNNPPIAPGSPSSTLQDGRVLLEWTAGHDDATPVEGLTYNLRIGTAPGAVDVMPPMSLTDTGRRQVVEIGNAGSNLSWRLRLPPGTYFWSVQAIDHSYAASPFSEEATFVVP